MKTNFYLLLMLIFFSCTVSKQENSKTFLFAGTYNNNEENDGIYVYEFNTITGELTEVDRENNLLNPSFLTITPNGKFLYACIDTEIDKIGSVAAFKIDSLSGKIEFINKQSSGGRNPVYVDVDKNNEFVVASNYSDAGVCIFKCNSDGSLQALSKLIEFEGSSIIKGRQDEAHVHSVNFDPDSNYLFAPDLGTDKIYALKFDKNNLITLDDSLTVNTEKGAGPRHFTFHPNKKFGYCVEELSGSVTAYNYKEGELSKIDTYFSYNNKQDGYGSADIHISPDGKFLYASNRWNENSISIFKINQKNGELSLVGHESTYGEHPRSFVISPSGEFLIVANQISGQIIVFKRDEKTGLLTKTKSEIKVNSPASLKMIEYSAK